MSQIMGGVIKRANDYYIHFSQIDTPSFFENYNQHRQNLNLALQQQYEDFFIGNIDPKNLKFINTVMNLDRDKFFDDINKEIKENLQAEIDIEKLAKLHEIATRINIKEILENAIDKSQVAELNSFFQIVKEALDLIEAPGFGDVVALTIENQNLSDIGKQLQNKVKEYLKSKNNQFSGVKKSIINKSANTLMNIGRALEKGKFKSTGNEITGSGMANLFFKNLISTDLAQGLGVMKTAAINKILNDTIKISLVGSKTITYQNQLGEDVIVTGGKEDISMSNVNTSIGVINPQTIQLKIGISSKFYTKQPFIGSDLGDKKITVDSGSGGSLRQAIYAIFKSDDSRYDIYNIIVHQQKNPQQEQYFKIRDLLLRRNLIKLFGSVGIKKDFAQFMIINGHIVSLYDLIKYIINQDWGRPGQAITLSIKNESKIIAENIYEQPGYPNRASAWMRSKRINQKFDETTIEARMHLHKLNQITKR